MVSAITSMRRSPGQWAMLTAKVRHGWKPTVGEWRQVQNDLDHDTAAAVSSDQVLALAKFVLECDEADRRAKRLRFETDRESATGDQNDLDV